MVEKVFETLRKKLGNAFDAGYDCGYLQAVKDLKPECFKDREQAKKEALIDG